MKRLGLLFIVCVFCTFEMLEANDDVITYIKENVLTRQSFKGFKMNEDFWETIVRLVKDDETLVNLDLSNKGLTWEYACLLGLALKENTHLKTLNLAQNSFSTSGCAALVLALQENKTLTHIDLSGNPIKMNSDLSVLMYDMYVVNTTLTNFCVSFIN